MFLNICWITCFVTHKMINSNKSCFWIVIPRYLASSKSRLTVTKVVFEFTHKTTRYWAFPRLTVTKVVFELKQAYGLTINTLINSNKSCFWIFIFGEHIYKINRLTVTKVVFELRYYWEICQLCYRLTVTKVVFE